MLHPEEKARIAIDKQLTRAGWEIVSREEYAPGCAAAVKEALMIGNHEADYLLFIDGKAIAVLEAKREENELGDDVRQQAEDYAHTPQNWYGLWFDGLIPLVYLANGKKIYFRNLLEDNSDYVELSEMHSPKRMLRLIGKSSPFGALPRLDRRGLRDCQYRAELAFESALKSRKAKSLAVLATGSGKTYLACLACYRLLNYTPVRRVLFLVDRNNLARQTHNEFSTFDRTENGQEMSSLYDIQRLRKNENIHADIVISTIQKLFAVLTGNPIADTAEDAEDEQNTADEDKNDDRVIQLGDNLMLRPDHFQLIIIDECHRSIYGKWRAVLQYFAGAYILGLTATPTPEAEAFFNHNTIERYTYEDSVIDGVNVPARIYRIKTQITEHGGAILPGTDVTENSRKTGQKIQYKATRRIDYDPRSLDRAVVNPAQIREVLTAYKNAIYTDLYPDRPKDWASIPKTLIFAKDDNHAQQIVEIAKEVFSEGAPSLEGQGENDADMGACPHVTSPSLLERGLGGEANPHFVQKITYTAEDSNALIRDFRNEKDFRIAVTVTLVATGTDVRPLEVVLFMKDVMSDVLYTQMKGRGCRVISDDKLREVTPNADSKDCYYIVDAVGVTEHEKYIPHPAVDTDTGCKPLSLEILLEQLAHGAVSDENMVLLRDICARIHNRYENSELFGHHLDSFIAQFGFSPKKLAFDIQEKLDSLPKYTSPSDDNWERMELIECLINNIDARRKLIEMKRGYIVTAEARDELIYAGFSKETARSFIDNFEKYLDEHKDSVEALRIIYNSEDIVITHRMLLDLRDSLMAENRQYCDYILWKNYKTLDESGDVDELDTKNNMNMLTNLIQIVRYAYKKSPKLVCLANGFERRFNLYVGQNQRALSEEQELLMKKIAEYVIREGALSPADINDIDADLWRLGIQCFGRTLNEEMQAMARILLKAA